MANVTLRDVAEAAGVTTATASRALSADKQSLVRADTRSRILQAADRLGYRGNSTASALRRGRTGTMGVVVADLSNPFIGPVLRGIAFALGARDLLPIMAETRDDSDELGRVSDRLVAQRVDGVICAAGRYRDRALLKQLASEVPTVLAVRGLPDSGIPEISHDDRAGGAMAAEHLLSLGHRRLAQLMGPDDIWSFEGRGGGFRDRAVAGGAGCVDVAGSGALPTVEEGARLATELLAGGGEVPTAVFAHNDSIAIGAIRAFRDQGLRCPEDIAVVGYNDIPFAEFLQPSLTTVRLPGYQLGRLAADLVVARIGGSEESVQVALSPELVVRQSTGTADPG